MSVPNFTQPQMATVEAVKEKLVIMIHPLGNWCVFIQNLEENHQVHFHVNPFNSC